MNELLSNVSIKVHEKVFIKNPETSALGKKIITGSIDLIEALGFEAFTFRKLAQKIGSTEASVYRYFESKHKLLLYLICWYWGWLEYRLVFETYNVTPSKKKLVTAIKVLVEKVEEDSNYTHINESKLYSIVISEFPKTYMTKDVKQENKDGIFAVYKSIISRLGAIILEVNPNYKYPNMLASTIVEGAQHQHYFEKNLPTLTDKVKGEDTIAAFFKKMVLKTIKAE